MDELMIQAYRETEYRIHGPTSAVLHVAVASAELAELHRLYQVECSAFITAYNPFSQVLDATSNALRQANLRQALQSKGFSILPGIGQHPSNQWPGEPSLLVLGIALNEAKSLGVSYEQNALIWSGPDAIPQLVLLRRLTMA